MNINHPKFDHYSLKVFLSADRDSFFKLLIPSFCNPLDKDQIYFLITDRKSILKLVHW